MVMGSTAHIYASFTCVQSTEFLICKFHHGSHKLYQHILSMTHNVTLLSCPETWPRNGMGKTILARQLLSHHCNHKEWFTALTHAIFARIRSTMYLICIFTIIFKHAVNEVKISFYSFFAYLSAY